MDFANVNDGSIIFASNKWEVNQVDRNTAREENGRLYLASLCKLKFMKKEAKASIGVTNAIRPFLRGDISVLFFITGGEQDFFPYSLKSGPFLY